MVFIRIGLGFEFGAGVTLPSLTTSVDEGGKFGNNLQTSSMSVSMPLSGKL